jgi:hypothetical protein
MRRGFEVGKAIARVLVGMALCLGVRQGVAELTAHDYSVEAVAAISENPPQISLQWPADPNAQAFQISRKILGDQSWTEMTTIGGQETSWTDGSVAPGVAYEYQIKKTCPGYLGWGYVCAAIRRSVVEDRGKIILVVESDLGASLPDELTRLKQDLIGDGWMVTRVDVSKTAPVTDVKNAIRNIYDADRSGTKAVFLFGHVPVPYSGDISPDMHPDDKGPWPADGYYGEFDGEWTDSSVTETNYYNPNVPGDGKFDQSYPPAPVRLQVGRVDLSRMTCFSNKTPSRSELDLARQYLLKDHNFRHGNFDVERRGMIFDRFYRGMELEPQTCAAWRSFPGFFGRDNVRPIGPNEYFPILSTNSYMWSYVVSGGSDYGSDYIGISDDWALQEPKVVFTSFLGSWFGQWDKESNFLRAPLGDSGYTLVAIFSGQPQWILHPMAMGEPIGLSAVLTQNNPPDGLYPPQVNAGFGQVHIDLLGDPTLRMQIVKPASGLTGAASQSGISLSWNASPDPAVIGYYVYRAISADGPYTRISGDSAVTDTAFSDASGSANNFYMVRALKLEQTPTGSFYNLSEGVFYPDTTAPAGIPETPRNLSIAAISQGSVDISWVSNPMNVRAFEIQRRRLPDGAFAKIGEATGSATIYYDSTLSAGIYAYRVKALGFAGDSDFSGEASINFNPSWANIAGTDTESKGNWIGKYGAEGFIVVGASTNLPSYASLNMANLNFVYGKTISDDEPETLWYPDGQHRLLAAWFNNHRAPMVFSFRFSDSQTHRVTFYMLDYHSGIRAGTLAVVDPYTGTQFGSVHFSNYQLGEYVSVDVRNYADLVVISDYPEQYGVPVDGIFFDAAPQSTSSTEVAFVAVDTTTQGDWKNKYGNEGDTIAAGPSTLPADIGVNQSNQSWTWDDSTTDPRALNKYSGDSGRIAAGWYSAGECSFDININSAQTKQIALYCLDWDNSGRVQDIIVSDPSDNSILLTKRIANFSGGQYVVFNAKGSIRVSAKLVNGPNAVVNGIFFGDAPAIISSDPLALAPAFNVANGTYTIRITGQPGQVFDVQSSGDFRSWVKIGQQTLSGTSLDFSMPFDTGTEVRFFRAVLAQ